MFVMIPAAVGLWALSAPIVRMSFEWREFDARSTLLTARALRLYAPGLIVFSLGKVFVPAFYALQDTRTPVRIGVRTVALNIVLSVLFMRTWPLEYKHAGIAFATVVSETFNGIWLSTLLHRRLGSPGWREISRSVLRSFACAVLMAGAAMGLQALLLSHLLAAHLPAKPAQIAAVLGAILGGGFVYLATARVLRSPELADLSAALRRRTSHLPAAPGSAA
jgi:putative peptidoglycan lipid II flippase